MANAQMGCGPLPQGDEIEPTTEQEPTDRLLLERFLSRQDEAAFTTLVRRYGPMVLSVCRRVLDHVQDAEDAFQATFLVLVRKAWSIGNPELLGGWLYGVAYRVARKARARAASRREQERRVEPMTISDPVDAVSLKEMQRALDRELHRLPAKYRQPLILCYLQGLTNEEAARRLGWPTGSMSYRLARGREMLRDRMQGRRRQVPPASLALLLALGSQRATVPARLVEATAHAAARLGSGAATASAGVSSAVASLVEATLQAEKTPWLKVLVVVLLLLLTAGLVFGAAANLIPVNGWAVGGEPADPGGTSPVNGATLPGGSVPAGHCTPP
jgi:RNA polymerase sigma factor (sigma-70 family)